MFTLIHLNSRFNKPATLLPFLQSNIGNTPMLCVDCVTPYMGTEDELVQSVCDYLSNIVPTLSVKCDEILNVSKETTNGGTMVKYLNLTIHVSKND